MFYILGGFGGRRVVDGIDLVTITISMLREDTVFVYDDARGTTGALQSELAISSYRDPTEVGTWVAGSCRFCRHDIATSETEQNFLSRHVCPREPVFIKKGPAAAASTGCPSEQHPLRLQQNWPRSPNTRRQNRFGKREPVQISGQFGKPTGKAADRDRPLGQFRAHPVSNVFVMSGEERWQPALLAERTESLRVVTQEVRDLLGRLYDVALRAGENKIVMVCSATFGQGHNMVEAQIIRAATIRARSIPLRDEIRFHFMMRKGTHFHIGPLICYFCHVIRAVLKPYVVNRSKSTQPVSPSQYVLNDAPK